MHPHITPLKFRTQQRKTKNNNTSWTEDTVKPTKNMSLSVSGSNSVIHTDRSEQILYTSRADPKNQSSDFIKKLIYENRTIQHNYQRLKDEYHAEEHQYEKLQKKFTDLKEAHQKLKAAIELSEKHEEPKKDSPVKQNIMSLMRKNTSILMMIAGKEPDSPMTPIRDNTAKKNQEIRNLRHLYKAEKHENRQIKKKNQKLMQAIDAMKLTKQINEQKYEYINNAIRIGEENKDLRNIVKELNDIIENHRKQILMQPYVPTI